MAVNSKVHPQKRAIEWTLASKLVCHDPKPDEPRVRITAFPWYATEYGSFPADSCH